MSRLYHLLFLTSLFWALVRADYTIDDSNYSILKFSENPAGPVWGPFGSDTGEVLEIRLPNGTTQTIDATQCFDGTYTYAACSTSNNCAVQFQFTGSGITVYVLRAGPQGMSASLSIDGGSPTTATLDAPPPPQYYIPRVQLLSVQNIPSGTHTAVMTVLDWNGGFSGMMLDYIDVNQAQVSGPAPSPSPSPNPSPTPSSNPAQSPSSGPSPTQSSSNGQTTGSSQQTTPTGTQTNSVASVASGGVQSVFSSQQSGGAAPTSSTSPGNGNSSVASSSSSKKNNLSAIVGGAVGGAVGLFALFGLALFCLRRRHHQQQSQTLNERPSPLLLPPPESRFTVGADPFASSVALATVQASGTSRPLQSWTDSDAAFTPNSAARDVSNTSPTTNLSRVRATSTGDESATSSVPLSVNVAATAAQDRDASGPAPVIYPNEKAGPAPAASRDVPSAQPNAVLTDNQADFVNSLFNNNVPAPVVARVLERMLANPPGANTTTGYNDPELRSHLNPGNLGALSQTRTHGGMPWRSTMSELGDGEMTGGTGTAPPSYDYSVQAQ